MTGNCNKINRNYNNKNRVKMYGQGLLLLLPVCTYRPNQKSEIVLYGISAVMCLLLQLLLSVFYINCRLFLQSDINGPLKRTGRRRVRERFSFIKCYIRSKRRNCPLICQFHYGQQPRREPERQGGTWALAKDYIVT